MTSAKTNLLKTGLDESQLFINTHLEVQQYFSQRKKYFHHDYYVHTRKKMNVLLTDIHEPIGGKWSFDEDNRKKYPKGKTVPQVEFPVKNEYVLEAMLYVEKHFNSNPGTLHERFMYPTTHASALEWLHQFLSSRFQEFRSRNLLQARSSAPRCMRLLTILISFLRALRCFVATSAAQ